MDGAGVAAKIAQGLDGSGGVEATVAETRELAEALERGSGEPRSRELRMLEIGLRAAVYSQTYLEEP